MAAYRQHIARDLTLSWPCWKCRSRLFTLCGGCGWQFAPFAASFDSVVFRNLEEVVRHLSLLNSDHARTPGHPSHMLPVETLKSYLLAGLTVSSIALLFISLKLVNDSFCSLFPVSYSPAEASSLCMVSDSENGRRIKRVLTIVYFLRSFHYYRLKNSDVEISNMFCVCSATVNVKYVTDIIKYWFHQICAVHSVYLSCTLL